MGFVETLSDPILKGMGSKSVNLNLESDYDSVSEIFSELELISGEERRAGPSRRGYRERIEEEEKIRAVLLSAKVICESSVEGILGKQKVYKKITDEDKDIDELVEVITKGMVVYRKVTYKDKDIDELIEVITEGRIKVVPDRDKDIGELIEVIGEGKVKSIPDRESLQKDIHDLIIEVVRFLEVKRPIKEIIKDHLDDEYITESHDEIWIPEIESIVTGIISQISLLNMLKCSEILNDNDRNDCYNQSIKTAISKLEKGRNLCEHTKKPIRCKSKIDKKINDFREKIIVINRIFSWREDMYKSKELQSGNFN